MSARAGGTVSSSDWTPTTGAFVGSAGTCFSTVRCSSAGTSPGIEGPGFFQNKNWGWPEGRDRGPRTWYSHWGAQFASTHVVHGRLASHLYGVIVSCVSSSGVFVAWDGYDRSPFFSLCAVWRIQCQRFCLNPVDDGAADRQRLQASPIRRVIPIPRFLIFSKTQSPKFIFTHRLQRWAGPGTHFCERNREQNRSEA